MHGVCEHELALPVLFMHKGTKVKTGGGGSLNSQSPIGVYTLVTGVCLGHYLYYIYLCSCHSIVASSLSLSTLLLSEKT